MSVYGNPLLPVASGSTGSPYTVQEKNGFSPGAVAIITQAFTLSADSKIVGGYSEEYKASPASSGGSVVIVAQQASLLGKITANGQSTDKDSSGEGGGGRISFYKVCWWDQDTNKEIEDYKFDPNVFEASAGKRPDFANEKLKESIRDYLSFIKGENGSN